MTVKDYQKDCFARYKGEIGYPESYRYFYGNPLQVLVPVETAIGKVMIVGAYPSAKFCTVDGISDVPLFDNDAPFSNETYFDGSRVRTIPSGQELNEVILNEIGILREDCWITDLVKVFLFKPGHVARYHKLKKKDITENRTDFKTFAKKSLLRLYTEIQLADPKVIITLGTEVASVVFDTTDEDIKSNFLTGEVNKLSIDGIFRNFFCLPHPGILMRHTERNPWPKRFRRLIAPKVRAAIKDYIK